MLLLDVKYYFLSDIGRLKTDIGCKGTEKKLYMQDRRLFFCIFICTIQKKIVLLRRIIFWHNMRIDILTACPELLDSPLNHSIVQRAKDKGLVEIYVHNLRDFTLDKHRKIDDYAFGFGAGMVLQVEPIDRAITYLTSQRGYDEIIFTAPDGERFTQKEANMLSLKENIIILCGHYKGVDQRVRDHLITKEYTIGDFVLTGGEIPAVLMTDAIVRLLPGAMGDETSALSDSFQDGLLEPGVYTRPAEYKGWKVPEILLSGHEAKISEWKYEMAIKRTMELRPDLLKD